MLVLLLLVIGVGLLVRSPATTPQPSGPLSAFAKDPLPVTPEEYMAAVRGGTWTTFGSRPPVNGFNPGASVWTGEQLLVGFTPEVAQLDLSASLQDAWTSLPPHPSGALDVESVIAGDGEVITYGPTACAGCGPTAAVHALDVASAVWRELPPVPGEVADQSQLVVVDGRVVLVRGATDGVDALELDEVAGAWIDLGAPSLPGSLRWQAIAAGPSLVVVGTLSRPDGEAAAGALVWDEVRGWRELTAGAPPPPGVEQAAVVWTGEEVVVLGGRGAEGEDPYARGSALDPDAGAWRRLPPLPEEFVAMPDLTQVRMLDGLVGTWDGERAVFVGGITAPLFAAWVPGSGWAMRLPTSPRAGGRLWWTGEQLLLWGGVDRGGPAQDLQLWPSRPGFSGTTLDADDTGVPEELDYADVGVGPAGG
jgi:hypothetical protein